MLEILECEQLCANAHCQGEALHRMSAYHAFCSEWSYASFCVSQYICDVTVVPFCMNSNVSTPLLSKKKVSISFWQQCFFFNFSTCLMKARECTALNTLWFKHSKMKPRFLHLLLLQCDWEINHHLRDIVLKITETILCFLCEPVRIFSTHLVQNFW
jgi:hypothetical protein